MAEKRARIVAEFALMPPEINSALMYAGPGSGSMWTAAAAWDGLATELASAASSFQTAVSIQEQIGNTTYYVIPTLNLPLLDPLRMIPILGNPLANLLQPFLQPFVDFGYATGLPGPLQSIGSLAIAGASPGTAIALTDLLVAGLPPAGLPLLSNAR